MSTFLADLRAVLRGDGIALDEAEARALGGPAGETISLWMAMRARHGSALAHLACLGLWLVQARHCRDQLAGVPMRPQNDLRAAVLLLLFAPVALLIGGARRLTGSW